MHTVFPVSYWGSVFYFQEIAKHETVFLEAFEHFPKQTHRNRFSIVSANGELVLTAPVKKPSGTKTLTKDVELISDKAILQKNWRAITSAYASSPFFDHYEKELEELFLKPNPNLVEHCAEVTFFLLRCWDINVALEQTTNYDWKLRSEILDVDFMQKDLREWENYYQVQFQTDRKFIPNPSSLDLLCNLGPMGRNIILQVNH